MGIFKPLCIASVKNVLLISGLFGSPNEIFDTPSVDERPISLTTFRAFNVSAASACCADTVRVKQSITRSFSGMPYSLALPIIFSAMATLSSQSLGTSSDNARPITTPPYLLATGNTASITASLPLTELISGLPLYILHAASIAAGFDESI